MQTFLPYECFKKSAKCLDSKRLGKQRVETLQILQTLMCPEKKGWQNHPATLMWKGFEVALSMYGRDICWEWIKRGYKDTCLEKITYMVKGGIIMPPWLGNKDFHASHRSNLLRKDPIWYGQYNWKEPDNLPYVWPVTKD